MRRTWSKERVVEAIRGRQRQGLVPERVWTSDKQLYHAARRYCGGWYQALLAAGLEARQPRKWSKAMVLDEIRLRQQHGLKMTSIGREDGRLANAVSAYFGGWCHAVVAAGLKPHCRCEWTAERVVEALQAWRQERSSTSTVWREDKKLYYAAKYHFGSLGKALLAAGVPPNRRCWNRQRVIAIILAGYSDGGPGVAIWKDKSLSMVAVTIFGSREQALLAAGFEPAARHTWTGARVVEAIRARHEQGLPLARPDTWHSGLSHAARRYFGTWNKALEALGLKTFQTRWSQGRIIRELQERHGTRSKHRGSAARLNAAIMRHFPSRRDALQAAGIDPDAKKWTKDRVIAAIQDRYVKGLPVQYGRCEDRALVAAASRLFANWHNALAAAGIARAERHR